ncbi:MAG: MFS transporter [Planctomycetaceae bacterium]|nr:MFS transporter [Planctomycetales bacterium]MCB9938640.1 MFS transporter [Planctomycetaceae bacterium]
MTEPTSASASREPSGGERPTRVRWLVFMLASGTSWLLYLHRYSWNFIRPALIDEYEFSNAQVDGLFTIFNASYAFGQIPGGIICDFFGVHLFLGIIIVLWSVLLPCFGLTGNFYGLAGLRLGFGAAQAGCYPSLTKVTRVWFPLRTRTIIQGLVASFFGRSGGAMSSIIMGTLLMGWFGLGWRVAVTIMGFSGVLFAGLFVWLYRNDPQQDSRVNQAELALIREGETETPTDGPRVLPFGRVIRNASMMIFIFQQFINAGADSIYVYVMGSYFMEARDFDVGTAGLLISLPLWGGALGGVVGGFVNDGLIHFTGSRRWSRTSVGFVGKLVACLMMFVAIQQVSGIAAALCLFVVKFFSDWTQPTVWGTCTDMGGRYSATVFSIINTSGSVGMIATPLLLGVILDMYTTTEVIDGKETLITNYSPMFTIVAAMYLISACCWLFINCTRSLERVERTR